MVAKSRSAGKAGKAKVGKLKLNRETIKNLSTEEKKKIKGKFANVNEVQPKKGTVASCCNCSFSGCASF
jgi:hypothetical protein